MRIALFLGVVFLVSLLNADFVEIKRGDGYRENLTTVEGTYKSRRESYFPYVCYDKRVRVVSEGEEFLTYQGCTRVDVSCASVGRAHFGRYSNDAESFKALNRCRNSRPRFVD
jgi:hypothetical protein